MPANTPFVGLSGGALLALPIQRSICCFVVTFTQTPQTPPPQIECHILQVGASVRFRCELKCWFLREGGAPCCILIKSHGRCSTMGGGLLTGTAVCIWDFDSPGSKSLVLFFFGASTCQHCWPVRYASTAKCCISGQCCGCRSFPGAVCPERNFTHGLPGPNLHHGWSVFHRFVLLEI